MQGGAPSGYGGDGRTESDGLGSSAISGLPLPNTVVQFNHGPCEYGLLHIFSPFRNACNHKQAISEKKVRS